ncbi:hypothetical protein ACFE04_011196 [Oxalis oulophora]
MDGNNIENGDKLMVFYDPLTQIPTDKATNNLVDDFPVRSNSVEIPNIFHGTRPPNLDILQAENDIVKDMRMFKNDGGGDHTMMDDASDEENSHGVTNMVSPN